MIAAVISTAGPPGGWRVRSATSRASRRACASPAVVAVVGAGNVGCALAADLSLRGVQVRLCTRSEARLQPIRDARALTVTGAVNGIVPISMLTTDLHQ